MTTMKLTYIVEELDERDVRTKEIPLFRVRVRGEKGTAGGFLNVVEERVSRLSECLDDLYAVLGATSWRPNTQYVARVQNVYLSSTLRGKGVGVKLYLAAACLCKERGLLLVSDSCAGGETSLDARRIYESRALKRGAHVSGLVFAAR